MHTSVPKLLHEQISERGGHISVADYMATCLYTPAAGYYMTRDPFGKDGDFTTAPEISQLFGEMVSVWVMDAWDKLGRPSHFSLIEGGGGRGSLMADILRTLKQVLPQCYNAANVTMLEISPFLKRLQRRSLADHLDKATWCDDIEDVSFAEHSLFIGNELLDAFPVNQFKRHENGSFKEYLVATDVDNFKFIESDSTHNLNIDADFVELSPSMFDFVETLKNKTNKGAILFMDYGAEGYGSTLQALQKHEYKNIFHDPGNCDLTTHINFSALMETLGTEACQYTTLAQFLSNLGLPVRASKLLEVAPDHLKEQIEQATYRLLHPEQMGHLFKAMCWRSANVPPLAGF